MRLKSSLEYKFSCAQCASEYVGMTTLTVGTRVDELEGVSYRTGARLTQSPHSAIRDHRDSCGTPFDTSNFKILVNTSCTSDLKFLESLYIYKAKPILNNQLSSYPLSIVNQVCFLLVFFSFFCVVSFIALHLFISFVYFVSDICVLQLTMGFNPKRSE